MIPHRMDQFLHEILPENSWRNRMEARGALRFIEFRSTDLERLHRLGIGVDRLGPRLVVCMWDEESEIEVGGYLVVDNLAMGRPSMGGIRMLPDITPLTVFNLARGMTLKNAAAGLPFGGGKAGIVAPNRDVTPGEHTEIIRRFARLLYHCRDIYRPGPDVGTDDQFWIITISSSATGFLDIEKLRPISFTGCGKTTICRQSREIDHACVSD